METAREVLKRVITSTRKKASEAKCFLKFVKRSVTKYERLITKEPTSGTSVVSGTSLVISGSGGLCSGTRAPYFLDAILRLRSIQPSLSLHCLGLLVHAEELCRFAFDVAETENKVPFELFLQRIPSTAHFRCFMSSGNRGGGKLVAPRIHSLTGRWSKIYVYPLPLTAAWQIFEPTKSFDERSSRAQYEYCIVWTMVTWWLLKWYSLFTGLHNLNWLFKRLRKEFLHQAFHAST